MKSFMRMIISPFFALRGESQSAQETLAKISETVTPDFTREAATSEAAVALKL